MPTKTRAESARSPNANRRESSNTTGSQGQGAAGRASTGGNTAGPGRARSVGRGVTERQTRGSDDTTSRRSVPASAAISTRGAAPSRPATSTSAAAAAASPEAGRSTTTASTRNSRRTSVTTRDGDRRRSTSQPAATTTAASTTRTANVATSAAATSGSATSATATSGTTTSATETSGSTTAATATSGTTTSGTATAASASRSPRSPRPHSGAPPTYEESVNHLTLEYGGYFVPYESRPIATPLTNVSSLSYSQVNLARGAQGHRGSRNSVGPIGVPVDRRLIDERNPRGRRQRRVGDLALTASERVVITEPITRELEEAEEEENGSCTKLLLPPMHICMATTCLVFNCVIPGSGTFVAAFGLFCCTKPDEWSCGKKIASSCLCLLVALAQIILTPVLLIGWIWSILWGFAYVGVSHQEYHGIKDDDDDEDELATIASGRGIRGLSDLEDDDTPWAQGYHRFDHPTSAPSHRRMSLAGTGSQVELEQRRQANMLRATRSYGYVEVHGLQGGAYGSIDHHRLARARLQRPPGSGTGSSNTLNSNRPMSQTTLTSYINDGMFLNNPPPPQPPVRTHPPSMVTIDM